MHTPYSLAAAATILTGALLAPAVSSQEGSSQEGTSQEGSLPEPPAQAIRDVLNIETGDVKVGADLAGISLPDEWGYLQATEARKVVEDFWGNPEDRSVIGMILPPNWMKDETSPTWGVIVQYEEDGYVEDDDAADIDYDDMLSSMKSDSTESNKARKEAGYPTVDLVGWAEPPHYDTSNHTLYWAKELSFEGEDVNTLNYNMRVLGRRGVLVLNAVADMGELSVVKPGADQLLAATKFNAGNRYTDYVSGDKIAAYGIGSLIAGKLLLKAGFLKILLGLWKPIAIGVVALGALVMKFFGGKKAETAEA